MDDEAILALVKRLSRVGVAGSATIERAAILAEGSDSTAVVAWILAHGGEPEAPAPSPSMGGLHSSRLGGRHAPRTSAPMRYVLPIGCLGRAQPRRSA